MSAEVLVARLPTLPYDEALALQNAVRDARVRGEIDDVLLLLDHWPVYTKGRRSDPAELPMGEDWYRMQGIEVAETDRGGLVTYHGPGQLVAYPIVGLGAYGDDVHTYVRLLEQVMLGALAASGVPAQIFDGLTGVWTAGEPPVPVGETGPQGTPVKARGLGLAGEGTAAKIGSIGVHVSRGVSTHGLAVNVNNDLQPFEWIVPCGIEHCRATSLAREHGAEQDLDAFAGEIEARYSDVFGRRPRPLEPAELSERTASSGAEGD